MFENEVIISETDKEQVLCCIKQVNEILDKYPHVNGFVYPITNMSRAKRAAIEAEKWIECLYTSNKGEEK